MYRCSSSLYIYSRCILNYLPIHLNDKTNLQYLKKTQSGKIINNPHDSLLLPSPLQK